MEVSYVAFSYWRMIKKGWFAYADIANAGMKSQVKHLAKLEVVAGTLNEELYLELIGESYEPIVEPVE